MYISKTKKEIIITKTEYAKAFTIGTDEFDSLSKAMAMFPKAKVVIKKSNNRSNYPRITKDFMIDYITNHDKTYLDEFKNLFDMIGQNYKDEAKDEWKEISFFSIRAVFLNRYPQFMTKKDREEYEAKKKEKNNAKETSTKPEMAE
ncbi:MAG: hypothetical protein IKU25_05490 [Clostridia bacterium]|nr:hypothetical protein [Clostridia bacterium]